MTFEGNKGLVVTVLSVALIFSLVWFTCVYSARYRKMVIVSLVTSVCLYVALIWKLLEYVND